ncbi:MAG: M23 family metallopeptidase, partial [Oscillospiraceae bacterium]|nr:M23 family metallopeptidase [Oscillospiraceae bacterium]
RELQAMMAELERQREAALERERQEAARRKKEAEAAAKAAAKAAAEAAKAAEEAGAEQQAQPQPTPEPVPQVVATGSFTWPVPSCTYITSRYGLRIHPIYKTERTHNGLDVGAGYGATIVAADSGTILRAANIGDGYGNCVIIDHGNGYMTLYAHMSSMTVREGQSVTKGNTIGYVGSTGLSTGPHCHFEVWSGGSRTDPEQFFSGLTFSADAGE